MRKSTRSAGSPHAATNTTNDWSDDNNNSERLYPDYYCSNSMQSTALTCELVLSATTNDQNSSHHASNKRRTKNCDGCKSKFYDKISFSGCDREESLSRSELPAKMSHAAVTRRFSRRSSAFPFSLAVPLLLLLLIYTAIYQISTTLAYNSLVENVPGGPTSSFSCGKLYYRTPLQNSPQNDELYVGAMNQIFRLDMVNINATNCFTPLHVPEYRRQCESKGRSGDYQCQNHIRVVQPVGAAVGENNKSATNSRSSQYLYVCGTNAYRPKDFLVHAGNLSRVENADEILPSMTGLGDGMAKCPFDPDDNSTAVWVANGNPGNFGALYSATVSDASKADSLIFRSDLYDRNNVIAHPYLRTIEYDSKWLNEPDFVGSFDIGDYVYFFFRESAMEYTNCGKNVFSRVARVCKSDTGGAVILEQNWSTYLKARLNCSIPGEFPFYFNAIQSVTKATMPSDPSKVIFYATFNTLASGGGGGGDGSADNAFEGAAVCAYTLNDIDAAFDVGRFKEQASVTSAWLPVLKSEVPTPRPGQCVRDTKTVPDHVLTFIKSHPLMDEAVRHMHGEPIHYERGTTFTSVQVVSDVVAEGQKYQVFFIGTSGGQVIKLAYWFDWLAKRVHSHVLDRYDAAAPEAVRWLAPSQRYNSLYVASDSKIVQYSLENCQSHDSCRRCASDPFCAWNTDRASCQPLTETLKYYSDPAFKQDVRQLLPQLCDKHAVQTEAKKIVSGQATHLQCRVKEAYAERGALQQRRGGRNTATTKRYNYEYDSDSELSVVWLHNGRKVPVGQRALRTLGDNGLIIIDTRKHDEGDYECYVGGRLMCRAQLKIDGESCKIPRSRDEYGKLYREWCEEFQHYREQVSTWKRKTLECINTVQR